MSTILERFRHWDNDAKPMLRWWFPDAGADLEQVRHQVESFVEAGYGGIELAMVPQNVDFDASVYGWATEHWRNIMKTIMKTAPSDFVVDFTITAHWPPALDTIDPNSPAAMQQLPFAVQKVAPGSKGRLPMPAPLRVDRDGPHSCEFIFKDDFIAASLARVKDVWHDRRITLEEDSLISVTDRCTRVVNENGEPVFTPAGVPEDADVFGNRPKMADKQYYYEIDLSELPIDSVPSEGEKVQPGDWLLFAYYRRGTGQTLSGRDAPFFRLQLPRGQKVYATDYFSDVSTKAITDFWEKEIFCDEELLDLVRHRKGAIFEDSIETGSVNLMWTEDMLAQFEQINGYDLTPMLPMVASSKGSEVRYVTESRIERRVRDDYEQTMNELYVKHHIGRLQEWTKTFGYEYRAQSYGGFIDTSRASVALDIAEGETLGFDDAVTDQAADKYRAIAGGVHMTGRKFVSQEALAMLMKAYAMTWQDGLVVLNRSMAAGANRAIFHGASFDRSYGNVSSQWPGWHAFAAMFAESWTDRQTYWADVREFNDYVARTQTVLQGGTPHADVAVMKKLWLPMTGRSSLMDAGFSYDIISGAHLFTKSAVVKNGVLAPECGSYHALLVHDIKALELREAEQLLRFAKDGLPVVFSLRLPEQAYGYHMQDDAVRAVITEMLSLPDCAFAETEEAIPSVLEKLGVMPSVQGDCTELRYIRRDEQNNSWYFLLNWSDRPLEKSLAIAGTGSLYRLNPWNGDAYSQKEAEGRACLKLAPHEAVILLRSEQEPGELKQYPVIPTDRDDVEVTGWSLELESWGPGSDPEKHPEIAGRTVISFKDNALGFWETLPASEEQLKAIGVDTMLNVAGIARYTARVQLMHGGPAALCVKHGNEMITEVKVNGIPADFIDHAANLIGLSDHLKTGDNLIEIRLATPLNNRVRVENEAWNLPAGGPPPALLGEETDPADVDTYDYEDYFEAFNGAIPENTRDLHYGLKEVSIRF